MGEQLYVRNPRSYFDRTTQAWHRRVFALDCPAIDVDLAGYCPRCYEYVYIIESTSNHRSKSTGLVERMAQRCGAVGLLIIHESGSVRGGRRVWPKPAGAWLREPDLRIYMLALRQQHRDDFHADSDG